MPFLWWGRGWLADELARDDTAGHACAQSTMRILKRKHFFQTTLLSLNAGMGQVLFFNLALFILSAATNAGAESLLVSVEKTTLATFNTALNPFYGVPNPNGPQLKERLSLLIEEVSNCCCCW